MRRNALLAAMAASALAAAGCSGGTTTHRAPTTSVPRTAVQFTPPETALHPEGYRPQAPPRTLPPTSGPVLHVSTRGAHLIEGFEGWSSCPYRDWIGTGTPWTRGYGETEGIGPYSPCISRAQGETNLTRLVETRYEWSIRALGTITEQTKWDALSSFVWNLGAGIFTGGLRFTLTHREWFAAGQIMLRYDHAGGLVIPGLETRRRAEVALFYQHDPAPSCSHACKQHALQVLYRLRVAERTRILTVRRQLTHLRCYPPHRPLRGGRCEQLKHRGDAEHHNGDRTNAQIRQLHREGVW